MSYVLPSRNLVSQQDAAVIQRPDVPRSKFLGSWNHKKTFDAGIIYPFLCDEVLPGDHMKYDVTAMVRMFTPQLPFMDSQRVDTHFFFVPNRLVWDNWVKFMGEQLSPADSIAYTIPQYTSTGNGFAVGSLADHFGLPTIGQPTAPLSVSVLPFRAYGLIFNEWFRDENLVLPVTVSLGDAATTEPTIVLRRRAKSHDYFTSCLPWPQKFTPPSLNIGGNAPVKGLAIATGVGTTVAGTPAASKESPNVAPSGWTGHTHSVPVANISFRSSSTTLVQPDIYADLSVATGISINQFREAMMVQTLLERDARGGTRYTEIVRSHFGVVSPDARQQRPEYIGGGSTPLQTTPVAVTTGPNVDLGKLGGAATAAGSHRASYAATEHGYIIGLVSVKSELSYSQGIHRHWSRLTRNDLYWPAFAGLGEQAVLQKELYALGTAADSTVFGYQERHHEYRTRTSEVTGLFRPTAAGNIDEWHLSQQFGAAPVLGATFIEDSPPMSRVLLAGATATNQQYLGDFFIRREATRPIPMFGTPATLGRF